ILRSHFRTTTNDRAEELLVRIRSLSVHLSNQQQGSTRLSCDKRRSATLRYCQPRLID
ncbi:hypothetical protein J6590_104406, partial [Homalodisca vitripennis]